MNLAADTIQRLISLNQQIIAKIRLADWEQVAELLEARHKGYVELFESYSSDILSCHATQLKLLKQIDKQALSEAKDLYKDMTSNVFNLRYADKVRKSYTQFL